MPIVPLVIPTRIFGQLIPVAPDMNEVVSKIDELVTALNAGLDTSNAIVGGPKFVRYRSSQLYGVPPDALTLDRLDAATILPGTTATVLNPADKPLTVTEDAKQYVAKAVPAGTPNAVDVPAYLNAPAGTTVPIVWQELAVQNQVTVTVAGISDATTAGRALLKAASATEQLTLLDKLSIQPNQYGAHPGFERAYGAGGLLLYLLQAVNAATAAPVAPKAPTAGQVDDMADTFSGLAVPGYASYLEYEGFGFPGVTGVVPLTAANAYQQGTRIYLKGLAGALASGTVGFRVAGSGSRPAGAFLTNADSFTGVVTPPNQLPVANAGSDLTITLPTSTVQLLGTGTDADGTVATYDWSQVTGPNTAVLTTASLANTAASGLVAGLYQFRLMVTDDKGGSKYDDVVVTVNAQPAPVIASFTPASGPVGSSITVTGTGFGASQGTSTVAANGVQASSITSWSNTSTVFGVPAGATTGKLTLTTLAGMAISANSFTVTVPTAWGGLPLELLGHGDSRTKNEGFSPTSGEAGSWFTTVVGQMNQGAGAGHYNSLNMGQPSQGTDFGLSALDIFVLSKRNTKDFCAQIMTVWYGVNDQLHHPDWPVSQSLDNLRQIVTRCVAAGFIVIVITEPVSKASIANPGWFQTYCDTIVADAVSKWGAYAVVDLRNRVEIANMNDTTISPDTLHYTTLGNNYIASYMLGVLNGYAASIGMPTSTSGGGNGKITPTAPTLSYNRRTITATPGNSLDPSTLRYTVKGGAEQVGSSYTVPDNESLAEKSLAFRSVATGNYNDSPAAVNTVAIAARAPGYVINASFDQAKTQDIQTGWTSSTDYGDGKEVVNVVGNGYAEFADTRPYTTLQAKYVVPRPGNYLAVAEVENLNTDFYISDPSAPNRLKQQVTASNLPTSGRIEVPFTVTAGNEAGILQAKTENVSTFRLGYFDVIDA
jgi:hypothetical protein